VDDLTKIILTAAGTLTVALVGALVGAWLQSRREHRRWIRERRLDAYALFFDRAMDIHRRMGFEPLGFEDWNALFEALSRVHLLGDGPVLVAAYAARDALNEARDDVGRTAATETAGKALDDFAVAARHAVGARL